MSVRRLTLLVLLAGLTLLAYAGWRGFLAILLWRGDFVLLERLGGEDYFLPAIRNLNFRQEKSATYRSELAAWAARRYSSRFPSEELLDLAWLRTDELLLLLRRTPGAQISDYRPEDSRLVVLDTDGTLVSDSGPFDVNAHRFQVAYFSVWEGATILVIGGGTGECGLLFRRMSVGFSVVPTRSNKVFEPFLSCWCGLEMVDLDGDGIPEIRGVSRGLGICPACGKDCEADVVIWKLVHGAYRSWTRRGESCGLACEQAWSIR